ncbi:MAG TPA: bifunctional diaminohydroxyphosphoribosylaminopyrimidine deaminase/5-amino-6-(5-phosphoribosylamino)uracil reductase RibD, partial [Verrucomicrobiae bacterium]|nr:bifunctional diaminohydroxyphosphoribosylaminopyrimidine deaminase/5-amino-6-(5-phosphoribosylamino)uracil reductase RibD [Verrucomicrobiae bacterium]
MTDVNFMRLALRLARQGFSATSPNPMVGAVLVKHGKIIGQGWHRRAGEPHAEIEALNDARAGGNNPKGSTLYVTLEPCSTHGRTPPCTDAIKAVGVRKVVVGAMDPNPAHAGRGFKILKHAGIEVVHGVLADEATRLNEAFNHWIVQRTPFVTVKAAMTLDGKIATARGESKWVTGEKARKYGMNLRQGADAVLVGINTVLADDPALTVRKVQGSKSKVQGSKQRIILDSLARTPLTARVVSDEFAGLTTIVVGKQAPKARVAALAKRVRVVIAPSIKATGKDEEPKIDLRWLLKKLDAEEVTSLLVEGGGEVNASFLLGGFAQRVAFFYAPKVLGGRDARKAVSGAGVQSVAEMIRLREVEWRRLGPDFLLTGR